MLMLMHAPGSAGARAEVIELMLLVAKAVKGFRNLAMACFGADDGETPCAF
jgi:hypothetical protein